MSILAAQMQLRRRWLSMTMTMMHERGAGPAAALLTAQRRATAACRRDVPCSFATATQKFLADTHQLTNEEIKREGIEEAKRPPGTGPGEYLHQRKHFTWEFLTSKQMVPMYPLIFMVFTALSLGIMTMYRTLVEHPSLILKKKQRRENPVPEVDESVGVNMVQRAREYYESSPLRKMALGESEPQWMKRIQAKLFHMPPRLPGDDKA